MVFGYGGDKKAAPKPEASAAPKHASYNGRAAATTPRMEVLDDKNDPASLKDYANRLQQVVMQQHTARREDWAHFHSREATLLDEVGELRRFAEDRDSMRWYETKLMEELRLERRKRIDLEARLTGADRWRTEAISAGRMARNAEVNMSFGQEAEMAEAREWQRNAARFQGAEERALAGERLAEDSLRRARQDLGKQNRALEKRSAEVELRAEASEAEALAAAYRLSGELRGEIDSVRSASARREGGSSGPGGAVPSSPAPQVSQARRALEDIRGVRERVDGLLTGYPM